MGSENDLVKSLDRGLSILDLLSMIGRDVRLGEIAASTDLPKSTVHRLLATLEVRGYTVRDRLTGSYRLGPKISTRFGTSRVVHDILTAVAMRSGETANLGVLVGAEVMYVDRADSPQALRWQMGVGSKVPAHCSGLGKILLAQLRDDVVDRLLPVPLEVHTKHTITGIAQLLEELAEVRRCNYALDDEEFIDGVRCVAVPVPDATGRVAAALSLAGPAFRLSKESALSQVQHLHGAAARIGKLLGGAPADGDGFTTGIETAAGETTG
jgi:DNA-binding IclR family transcriptional regulator